MARFVRKEESGITRDYVNLPEPKNDAQQPERGTAADETGRKLFKLVAVSFGLLCVLQAALNISLRLALFTQARYTNLTAETIELRKELLPFDRYFQEGWVYIRPSFYYISSSKKSWQESRDDCRNRGADLVIINSENEQDFTRKFELQYTWIGLSTGEDNNTWIWVDGSPLSKSYWGPGEPNDYLGTTSRNERCVEIRFFEERDSWNDRNCNDQNQWICEMKIAL